MSLDVEEWDGPDARVHGDITCGNLLAPDGWIRSVIGFGPLGVGDPPSTRSSPNSCRQDAPRQLFGDELAVERDLGQGPRLGHVELPCYRHTSPDIVAESRQRPEEVLADVRGS
jgi:hypothetical protein